MTSPTDHIGGVERRVGTTDRDGRELRRLSVSRSYPTTREDLWRALTDPERLPRWFLPVTGDLRVGGRYQLEGNAGGEVLSCEPPRSLAVTWEYDGQVSWVSATLTPAGEETRLELVHDVPADAHWDTFGPGAVGIGWELGLLGLADHVVTGAPVDPAVFAAWTASDEGAALVSASSAAWADARIASGGDPEESRAAAARCTAAYTGQE